MHHHRCVTHFYGNASCIFQALTCCFSKRYFAYFPNMKQHIAHIALVVKDYDEAIAFYTQKLHFSLLEDTKLSETKRWVMVAPPGATECCLLLAQAANEKQVASVGNQTGGRVFLFLHTDDFDRDYADMIQNGIVFVREPVVEEYGKVAVFADLYGNLWDLIEPTKKK
jgi:catechol 2,3-dioxygenase-like lactoylglutathione lyase family enzyme